MEGKSARAADQGYHVQTAFLIVLWVYFREVDAMIFFAYLGLIVFCVCVGLVVIPLINWWCEK